MEFSYTEVYPGSFRPIVPLWIYGPAGASLTDGLLDTGADQLLLPPRLAQILGIDLDALTTTMVIRAATDQPVICKMTTLVVGLKRNSTELFWQTNVAIATQLIQRSYWGHKGFLEFFRADFDGPARVVTLTPGSNLPVATPPP